MREQQQRQQRRGHASIGEPARDPPIDRAVIGVHRPAADLGDARVQEVSPDGGRRMDTEGQHEQRSHEGAAAYSGNPDQKPDGQPGDREDRIDAMQHCRSLLVDQKSNVD